MTDCKSRLLVALAATTAACSPRGTPPSGHQIVADRQASLGAIVPPNGDGVLRILLLRPGVDAGSADLYVLSLDAAGEPSPERLLISDIDASFGVGCSDDIAPCPFDAKGRVLVHPNGSGQPGGGSPGAWVDPNVQQQSIRRPLTGAETVLPFDGNGMIAFSPDWQSLLYTEPGAGSRRFSLFDDRSGQVQVLDIPPTATPAWRPGHDQIWASTPADDPHPTTWIVTPGAPTITLDGVRTDSFSRDGAYWFSTSDADTSTPALQIGTADDPMGPRFPYNPPGTFVGNQWVLPDGRMLFEVYTTNLQRTDLIALDPRTGESHELADRGFVAAAGDTRVMGMFPFAEGRGDLTTVALDTGKQTVLARELAVTAFAEPQGTDLLAPGTRVVYQLQAPTASSYDGIWVVSCP